MGKVDASHFLVEREEGGRGEEFFNFREGGIEIRAGNVHDVNI